jgi:hypothetical protein
VGVKSDLVIADLGDAQAVAESDSPAEEWEGFSFNGLDNIKLCTLLSLLRTGSPSQDFGRYLDLVETVTPPTDEGPEISAVHADQVGELAAAAGMENERFDRLASAWGSTEEFEGWSESETTELLRAVADLAVSASLEGKCLLLWRSL